MGFKHSVHGTAGAASVLVALHTGCQRVANHGVGTGVQGAWFGCLGGHGGGCLGMVACTCGVA